MGDVYLCGHTGSENRGAEAIVRSTAKLLKAGGHSAHPVLATFSPAEDIESGVDSIVDLLPYATYPSQFARYALGALRRLTGVHSIGQHLVQRPLWAAVQPGDLCLNIGGDIYCYGTPTPSLALNQAMQRKGIPTVLWCCSIEARALNSLIKTDLRKYRYIVAREKLTYDLMLESGIPARNVLFGCDPAFHLSANEVPLPDGFMAKDMVGLNLSDLVMHPDDPNDMTYRNVVSLMEYILNETSMGVCLIPHVYSAARGTGDIRILSRLYDLYRRTGRVCMVNQDYGCEELKYIISQCRFFIGARTHSTIAAYSTHVPTLVLGYSVKSRGIATDLFGTYEGYVLPYQSLRQEDELLEAFRNVQSREDEIIAQYEAVLPGYSATVVVALAQILRELV